MRDPSSDRTSLSHCARGAFSRASFDIREVREADVSYLVTFDRARLSEVGAHIFGERFGNVGFDGIGLS